MSIMENRPTEIFTMLGFTPSIHRRKYYTHVAPLGLEDLDIPPGYKHAAPLGLKTRYPIFTFFHDSLVYERQPQGLPLQIINHNP